MTLLEMKIRLKLIIIVTVVTTSVFGQKKLKYESSAQTIKVLDSIEVDISRSPITNRDYLIYILWRMNVYGADYLTPIIEVFPGLTRKVDDSFFAEFYEAKNPFEFIMNNSQEYVRNYMYNVEYLDYPVLGLNWKQAFQFNKWLSDRYNEYELIQNGLYEISIYELDEDCFVTEAYLYDQYYGQGRLSDSTISWEDSLLLPCFRLPTQNEVKSLNNLVDSNIEIRNYQKDKKSYLEPWQNLYLSIKPNQIQCFNHVILGNNKIDYIIEKPEGKFNIEELVFQELYLEEKNNLGNLNFLQALEFNGYKIMSKNNFVDEYGYFLEKDSLGFMQFIIIDTDQIGEPKLIVYNGFSNTKNVVSEKMTVFRFAVSTKNKKVMQKQ